MATGPAAVSWQQWQLVCCMLVCVCTSAAAAATVTADISPKHWTDFGIHLYRFTGTTSWLLPYTAEVHARLVCSNATTDTMRMVVILTYKTGQDNANQAAATANRMQYNTDPSLLGQDPAMKPTPQLLLFGGQENASLTVTHYYWDIYMTNAKDGVLIASADVPARVPLQLGMQGSSHMHQVQQQHCSRRQHALFTPNSVWLGVVPPAVYSLAALPGWNRTLEELNSIVQLAARNESIGSSSNGTSSNSSGLAGQTYTALLQQVNTSASLSLPLASNPGAVLRFLAAQHFRHHTALGFNGSIMVARKGTVAELMEDLELRTAVERGQLVMVLWDEGSDTQNSHFLQRSAYNLLRLAAWGANTTLGLIDLDEYMVMPRKRPVYEEIASGCLLGALASNPPEAIIYNYWVGAPSFKLLPEVAGWMLHGDLAAALQGMGYLSLGYKFCHRVCKALINPNSDLIFEVHSHHKNATRIHRRAHFRRSLVQQRSRHRRIRSVSPDCSYILHFYRLFRIRDGSLRPNFMKSMRYHGDEFLAKWGTPVNTSEVLKQ